MHGGKIISKAFEMLYGFTLILIRCFLGGIAYTHRNCRPVVDVKGKKNPVCLSRDTLSLNNFEFFPYIHGLNHLLYVFVKLMILHLSLINHSIIQSMHQAGNIGSFIQLKEIVRGFYSPAIGKPNYRLGIGYGLIRRYFNPGFGRVHSRSVFQKRMNKHQP